jgi:hypothetical protein
MAAQSLQIVYTDSPKKNQFFHSYSSYQLLAKVLRQKIQYVLWTLSFGLEIELGPMLVLRLPMKETATSYG